MQVVVALITIAVAAFTVNAARAFPDGAPWGAANPAADQNCASCHFGADPVRDSEALVIDGLPVQPAPGAIYELKIIFEDPEIVIAGFQLLVQSRDQQAGTFVSAGAGVEFIGAAIRSTAPLRSDQGVSWAVEWRAPGVVASPIVFYVAASAANDDGSPFGDTIHFRSYNLAAELRCLLPGDQTIPGKIPGDSVCLVDKDRVVLRSVKGQGKSGP